MFAFGCGRRVALRAIGLFVGIAALLTVAPSLRADTVLIEPDGKLTLTENSLAFYPRLFLEGWRSVEAVRAGEAKAEQDFRFDFDGATIRGTATFAAKDSRRISARWSMTADHPVAFKQLFIASANLPEVIQKGGSYMIDGVESSFPPPGARFVFGRTRDVRELVLKDRKGNRRLAITFDEPTAIVFQDNDKYGMGVDLRLIAPVRELKPGDTLEWKFTLETCQPSTLETAHPIKIAADGTWIPLTVKKGVVPGSALDFAAIGGAEAPAGRYGRVVVRNGHFEFEHRPGVPQRFCGVNLCNGANFPRTVASAEAFADELVRRGYNAVRLHHHDGMLVEGMADSTTLNPTRMRELDALVAALVRKGIYTSTDLYVSRPIPWREVGCDRPGTMDKNDFKMRVREDERAFSNLCTFAENWFTHTNEFTGRRWADEPGIAWISLVNENCPDNFRRDMDTSAAARYAELEVRFYARMTRFLKENIGAKQLFTDLNGWSAKPRWTPCRARFDYVDLHFYVDHPNFLERPWQLPSACVNRIPFTDTEVLGAGWAGACRLSDKPFTISEWNFAAPGRYRGAGGLLVEAWAARENWDGLWRFDWSHEDEGVENPCGQALRYFSLSGDPLACASERAVQCLFRRGDLKPGDTSALTLDACAEKALVNTPRTVGGFARRGGFEAGILSVRTDSEPATVWVSSLDDRPLVESGRMLLSHLTDLQNTGARFADSSMRVLQVWGDLPHLMRNAKAEVTLSLNAGDFTVYVLNTDGSRRQRIPSECRDGRLSFVADIARNRQNASFLYEIIRNPNPPQ